MKNKITTSYPNYYIAENILDWPGQLAIVKLSEPKVFVRFDYGESYFAGFDEWRESIAIIEWIDGTTPSTKKQEDILTDCWNFLALTEREEERLAEQREEEEDDEFL